jgi:protoheme IX farnesyltransferase
LSVLRDLATLTKPRITALVLVTEAAGLGIAPGRASHVGVRALLLSLVGTALIVGAANTLNMWWEADTDARMERTRNRPLPAGRLSSDAALAFGLALAAVSVPMLFLVNLATGLLGLVALVSYVAVYTPLKRHTSMALLVGAVPGAMPPLMGWSTAVGNVAHWGPGPDGGAGLGGLLLFVVLFLWQLPHFAAISIFRAEDYARAGLQVVSVQHGEAGARRSIAVYTALLVAASLLFVPLGIAGTGYAVVAAVTGIAFLGLALRGVVAVRSTDFDVQRWAKTVFATSIPYLTVLVASLVAGAGR